MVEDQSHQFALPTRMPVSSDAISRSLNGAVDGALRFELQMLADYILERIKEGERIFADENDLAYPCPRSRQDHESLVMAYARDDRPYGGTTPPMVAYRFEDSRGAHCVARHLAGRHPPGRRLLGQQGFAAADPRAKVALAVGVVGNQVLIPLELLPGNICLMVAADQNLPVLPVAASLLLPVPRSTSWPAARRARTLHRHVLLQRSSPSEERLRDDRQVREVRGGV